MKLRLLPLVALAAALPARAADRYLAVLELGGTADQFALEALTDRARSVASEALRGRWLVTTRENVLERLRRTGKGCDAAGSACVVELGRAVGAELVLSGVVNAAPGKLEISAALHDTRSARPVAQVEAEYPTAIAALDGMSEVVLELLRQRSLAVSAPLDLYDPGFSAEVRAGGMVPTFHAAGGVGQIATPAYSLIASYRLRERWALEALGEWNDYDGYGDFVDGAVYHFAAGGEWTLSARHHVALAGGLGVSRLRRTLRDVPGVAGGPPLPFGRERETAPSGWAELRLDANMRLFQLGARVGARALWKRETLSSPSGARKISRGFEWDVPFGVSLRVLL